jgi:hypothetical protein
MEDLEVGLEDDVCEHTRVGSERHALPKAVGTAHEDCVGRGHVGGSGGRTLRGVTILMNVP